MALQPTQRLPGVWFAVAGLAIACGVCSSAHAFQVDLGVTPGISEVVCKPGGSADFTLTVDVRALSSMDCSVAASPMDVDADGVPSPRVEHCLPDASKFTRLGPRSLSLASGQSTIYIRGVVTLPRQAAGSYYCIVSVMCTPHSQARMDAGMGVTPEVRAVVMVSTPTPARLPVPAVSELSVLSGREGGPLLGWSTQAAIRNPGDRHIVLDGKVTILGPGRRIVESAPLEAGYGFVFPGRDRQFRAAGRKRLADGAYQALLTVRARGGAQSGSRSVAFIVKDGKVRKAGGETPPTSRKKGL